LVRAERPRIDGTRHDRPGNVGRSGLAFRLSTSVRRLMRPAHGTHPDRTTTQGARFRLRRDPRRCSGSRWRGSPAQVVRYSSGSVDSRVFRSMGGVGRMRS
jgi:hypothetical protein